MHLCPTGINHSISSPFANLFNKFLNGDEKVKHGHDGEVVNLLGLGLGWVRVKGRVRAEKRKGFGTIARFYFVMTASSSLDRFFLDRLFRPVPQ